MSLHAMQVLLETSPDKKQCHLKGPHKLVLWCLFFPIFYWKELTNTIGENHCVILNISVIAEIAEIKEMGEWMRSLFNWCDVNVDSEWGNGLFSHLKNAKTTHCNTHSEVSELTSKHGTLSYGAQHCSLTMSSLVICVMIVLSIVM